MIPLLTEPQANGDTLYLGDKPWIQRANGSSVHCSLCLRRWYDKNKGFVKVQTREDNQVINLGRSWAKRWLDDNL